ncbi:MAG TPA: ABC transporter permease [Gemmatimonadales bacterium]|nr:ABC transporter permease [Gemmatimonadales bacterium]
MSGSLRQAGRSLARSPGYAVAVILTLALGIGGAAAVASVLRSVLLRPVPSAPADRVMSLAERDSLGNVRPVSYPTFQDWRAASTGTFEALAFARGLGVNLKGDEGAERLVTAYVTEDFFRVLRSPATVGRTLQPDDFRTGGQGVVVLSHRLWLRRFGGDPSVVGRTLRLDRGTPVVVGVMPADYAFPPWAELFAPIGAIAADPALTQRTLHVDSRVVGLLRPGLDSVQAGRQLSAVAARLAEAYPAEAGGYRDVTIAPAADEVLAGVGPQLRLLTFAALLVLLIASVNIANLSLARATVRARELAVRTALGASRGALLRLLAAESALLGAIGAGLGLLGAFWCIGLIRNVGQAVLPRAAEIVVDWRLVLAAAAIAVLLVVALGVLPAVWHATADLGSSLREGRGSGAAPSRRRMRAALVVAEFALALVLLVGSGLLGRSLLRLQRVDPGFDVPHLLAAPIAPPSPRYDDPARALALYRAAADAVAAEPGVQAVALTNHIPLTGASISTPVETDAQPTGREPAEALFRVVDERYFATAGIPVLQGRAFSAEDMVHPGDAVLVNRAMARRWWPDGSAIGRRIVVRKSAQGRADFGEPVRATVIGVVGNVRHFGVEVDPVPEVYLPYTLTVWPRMTLLVRVAGSPDAAIRRISRTLARVEPDLPLIGATLPGGVETLPAILDDGLAYRRLIAGLLGAFAFPALLLAALGIYGVIAYLVAQRTGEIAIRLALGSTPNGVRRLVLRDGLRLALVGVMLGLGGALALTRWLRSELFQVSATDPVTLVGSALLLVAVAALATWLPAQRATRVSPMAVLRSE